MERIAKAVWVPRARNTSNGNAEVMVVDEVHKTTRMLNDEGFALSQACKVSEMKGGVKFGGAAC